MRSAGLAAIDGGPADPLAIETARDWKIDLVPHRARLLTSADLEWARLVLVMTAPQARAVIAHGPSGIASRVRLLGDYLPVPPFGIDDPYGLPADVFHACFQRIDAATGALSLRLG